MRLEQWHCAVTFCPLDLVHCYIERGLCTVFISTGTPAGFGYCIAYRCSAGSVGLLGRLQLSTIRIEMHCEYLCSIETGTYFAYNEFV